MKSFPAFGILLGSRAKLGELRALLEKSSGLPGPRANLELGASFATAVSRLNLQVWQWAFLVKSASADAKEAPENTPKVYVVFCALLALGQLYGGGLPRPRRREALAVIQRAAQDERWRVREACAMALQKVGEADAAELQRIVTAWVTEASWLEMRAIVAALAHPPILSEALAGFSVEVGRRILTTMSRADARERRTEPYKILRQGMGYALSVFTAAAPAAGFALLRKTAAVRDSDLALVVRENLKKKRLSESFQNETAQVSAILQEANPR